VFDNLLKELVLEDGFANIPATGAEMIPAVEIEEDSSVALLLLPPVLLLLLLLLLLVLLLFAVL